MQGSFVILLVAVVALSALAAWLGLDDRRRYVRRYRVVAMIGAFGLVPMVGFVLWKQAGAPRELAVWGLVPHPAIIAARGLPTAGPRGGMLAFTVAAPADSIRAFYLDPRNVGDWKLALIHPSALIFERGADELTILISPGRGHPAVSYALDRGAP